jgi:hypothetical protein
MWLQEEYFNRHGIDALLPLHAKKGSMFLGPTDNFSPNKIFFIYFEWREGKLYPGRYAFNYFRPIHNGCRAHRFFESIKIFNLHSDEYEDYWVKLNKSNRFFPITSSHQVQLMAWSIFLFCYDEWASKNGLQDLFFETIDPLVSEEKRMELYKKSLLYLRNHHPSVYSNYDNQVLSKVKHYSYWAAKLIGNINTGG